MSNAELPRGFPNWLPYLWSRVLFPGRADPNAAVRPVPLALLVVLPALLLYPTVGFRLLEPDEGRYAEIPREMLERGEWVVPTLQGEPYLDKPPLMYWLVMASYRLFGVSRRGGPAGAGPGRPPHDPAPSTSSAGGPRRAARPCGRACLLARRAGLRRRRPAADPRRPADAVR